MWLSIAGREKLRSGLIACFYSLIGALIGGLVLFFWSSTDQVTARHLLEGIPGINSGMINDVNQEIIDQGLVAILFGPLSGTPYKIYAVQAAGLGANIWMFMFISIFARLIRFILVTTVCHYVLKLINVMVDKKYNLKILIIGWIIFYVFYFSVMGI